MKKRALILFLVLALFLVPSVAAEFSIQSGSASVSVCPTSTVLIQDIVSSTVNAPYSITISGPAASFTTAVPPGFYLNAGQSQTVYLYITPPSTTMPGNYNLVVTVESQGITKQTTHQVVVENCHLTSLTAKETTLEICSCDEKDIILELENQGNYLEKYELSIGGAASSWITLSPKSIDLLPGSKADIIAHLKVPCGTSGDYETTFNVKSKNSIAQASDSVSIKVYPCYDYILSTEKNYYEVCENNDVNIPISVKNVGTQDNVYQINFQGPSWASIDKREVSVKKGQTETVNIVASPPIRTLGQFTLAIEVMSINGKVLKKQEIKIDSIKCYDLALAIAEEKEIICNGLSASYALEIGNSGKFSANYDIVLEAPSWVKVSEKQVTLGVGESKSLSLTISPPKDAISQDYTVKITARETETKISAEDSLTVTTASQEQCYKPAITTEKEAIKVAQDSTATVLFIIENKGTQDAIYDIAISGTGTQFSQINPGTIEISPLKAENLYLYIAPSPEVELGTYTVTVTARLKDTTILATKTVDIEVVEAKSVPITGEVVGEGEKEEAPTFSLGRIFGGIINFFKSIFSFEKPEEENVTITIGEELEEEEMEEEEPAEEIEEEEPEVEEEINVTKEEPEVEEVENVTNVTDCEQLWWYDDDNQLCQQKEFCGLYMYQGLYTFETKSGCEESLSAQVTAENVTELENVTEVENITAVENVTEVEEVENVTEEIEEEPAEEVEEETIEEEIEETKVEVTGEGPYLEKDIPDIKIKKGEAYTIDLNEYFADPTEDTLYFTAVKPLNVTLQMVKNVVTIKPDSDFEGERTIVFYASDGKETKASNEVKIIIGKEEAPAGTIDFSSILYAYRYYFIGAAIILVIIIILLSGLGEKIVAFFEEEVEEKPGVKPGVGKPGEKPAAKKEGKKK